jgi:hypothetical protein
MQFGPETKRVMGLASAMTCVALKLTDLDDEIKPLIASKIIELARAGERDPNLLCELELIELRENQYAGSLPKRSRAQTDTPTPSDSQQGRPS